MDDGIYLPTTDPSKEHEHNLRGILNAAPKTQSQKFIETARELGCDEDADVDEVMRKLASQKPEPRKPKAPREVEPRTEE